MIISPNRFRNFDPVKIRIQKLTVDVRSAKKSHMAFSMDTLIAGFFKHSTGSKVQLGLQQAATKLFLMMKMIRKMKYTMEISINRRDCCSSTSVSQWLEMKRESIIITNDERPQLPRYPYFYVIDYYLTPLTVAVISTIHLPLEIDNFITLYENYLHKYTQFDLTLPY